MKLLYCFTFTLCLAWASHAAPWNASFPYMDCTPSSKSRYSVSPAVSNPAPNTYCFTILADECHYPSSYCCSKANIATFALNASTSCDGASITATLDYQPLGNVTTVRPPKAASNSSRLLLIPELHLNATSIRPNGSQLCITLPSSGKCSSLKALSASGRSGRWSASLLSSNEVCCPVSRGRTKVPAPPKGTCQTCMVYDVVGLDGTAATTKFNFLSRKSCEMAEAPPEQQIGNFANCCEWAGSSAVVDFDYYRGLNMTGLSGFDRPFCNRTSLRVCGTVPSSLARQVKSNPDGPNPFGYDLTSFFDISDDSFPLGIINSRLRVYSTEPGSDKLDTKCFPLNDTLDYVFKEPTRREIYKYSPDLTHFPNERCQSDPGVTPFTVDPYLEIIWASSSSRLNATNLYCLNLMTAQPANASSPCGKTNSISRVSMWLDESLKDSFLAAYLLTADTEGSSGDYVRQQLNMTWGPTGDNALIISLPNGLDVPTVNATQPKVCVEMPAESMRIWYTTMANLGFLWTALFDESGKCCPTFYANRY